MVVGVDGLLKLWHKQLPVVVKEPVIHRYIEFECSWYLITVTTAVRAQSTAVAAPSDSLCKGSDLASNTLCLLSNMLGGQLVLPQLWN